MRNVFLSAACAAAVLGAPALAQADPQACLGLRDAMARAAQLDPSVDIGLAERDRAQADLDEARGLFHPQLSAFGRAGVGDTGLVDSQIENQLGLQVSQRIWDFGDARHARASASASLQAGEEAVAQARIAAAEDAGSAYLGLLETRARLDAVSERAAFFQRQLDALDGAPEGATTRSERAEVAARLATAQATELDTRLTARQFERRLLTLTGDPRAACGEDGAALTLDTLVAPMTELESARQRALGSNAELRRLEAEARSASSAAERERRNRLPEIALVGRVSYIYDDVLDEFDYRDRIGIDVSVPLYTGAALNASRRRADADAGRLDARMRDVRRLLIEEVEISLQRLASLEAQLIRLETAQEQAALQLGAALEEFDAGARTLPELIEVRLDYEQAVLDLITVRFDRQRTQLRLASLGASVVTREDADPF